ncbi:MAG: TadE family type IV pilus minor pilin [Bifidobacteriaceae bacterium]|nr:TadE family type IV pilus minor pilin [Bifidobacteriaceae bacterium]
MKKIKTRILQCDKGVVTAEFALALPAVILVSVLCIGGFRYVSASTQCYDIASIAGRSMAISDDFVAVNNSIREQYGSRIQMQVQSSANSHKITVSCPVVSEALHTIVPTRVESTVVVPNNA